MSDADAMVKKVMAEDAVRRAAQAANLSDAPLHAAADQSTPVPLPEDAENVKFDGAEGKLEFDSVVEREGAGGVLSRDPETAGLEGAAFGDQQIQHGGDGIFQGRQGAVVHGDAAGPKGECHRRRLGPRDGQCHGSSERPPDGQCRGGERTGRSARARSRLRLAGTEGAFDEFDRDRETAGHRDPVPQRTQRQRSRRAELGPRLLSRRTRQARMEGIRRPRRREAGSGATGVCRAGRAGNAETLPQRWRDQHQSRAEKSGRGGQGATSCPSRGRPS